MYECYMDVGDVVRGRLCLNVEGEKQECLSVCMSVHDCNRIK